MALCPWAGGPFTHVRTKQNEATNIFIGLKAEKKRTKHPNPFGQDYKVYGPQVYHDLIDAGDVYNTIVPRFSFRPRRTGMIIRRCWWISVPLSICCGFIETKSTGLRVSEIGDGRGEKEERESGHVGGREEGRELER